MERELLLLGLLRNQNMHGYQLMEFIEQVLGRCTDLKKPTAYFLLDKMTKEGLLSFQQTREGRRPLRRVFHLTSKGEQTFQRLLRENLAGSEPVYFQNDIGLAFINEIPTSEALSLLERRWDALESQLAALLTAPQHHGSAQWMVSHQVHHLRSELDWLKKLTNDLSRIEKSA